MADSGYAPTANVLTLMCERCRRIADLLLARGIDLMVVACNTATAVAVDELRTCWPTLPIVGVEPGSSRHPDHEKRTHRRVGHRRHAGQLRRYAALIERYALKTGPSRQWPVTAWPGRSSDTAPTPPVLDLVNRYASQVKDAGCDTAVLGCTHYPLCHRPGDKPWRGSDLDRHPATPSHAKSAA